MQIDEIIPPRIILRDRRVGWLAWRQWKLPAAISPDGSAPDPATINGLPRPGDPHPRSRLMRLQHYDPPSLAGEHWLIQAVYWLPLGRTRQIEAPGPAGAQEK